MVAAMNRGLFKAETAMISLTDYSSHDGLGLAALVARKEVTPKELLDTALAAVAKVNPQLNAVLQTTETPRGLVVNLN